MKLKQTIWLPVAIGIIASLLILLAAEVHFVIPVAKDTSAGTGEIFTTLAAAAGGPIAVLTTLLVTYAGAILLNPELFTDIQAYYVLLADGVAHLSAMLVVAFCYFKLLCPHARNNARFLGGWWLLVVVYYFLVLLPLSVVLNRLANPGYIQTYSSISGDLFPEFLITATITTILWYALPAHYRRSRWLEGVQTAKHLIEVLDARSVS